MGDGVGVGSGGVAAFGFLHWPVQGLLGIRVSVLMGANIALEVAQEQRRSYSLVSREDHLRLGGWGTSLTPSPPGLPSAHKNPLPWIPARCKPPPGHKEPRCLGAVL